MTDPPTGGSPVAQLQDQLLATEDITDFLNDFTATMAQALSTDGDEVWCAVTLLRPKRSTTVAASSPHAEALDEIQYHYGDGPCLTAAREHRLVYVRDTRTDPRWPAYGQAAAEAGILSALGVPMELGGEAAAGLDVYADTPNAYDQAILEVIRRQVVEVSTILRLAVRLARHRDTEADLQAAMASRTTIDLAVGIVMGQNRCSQEKAFEILRAASSHRNIKLRDVAADLVATVGKGPASTHFDA
ncbi:response regulator receiver protein [Kocuria sp. CCUG 69068]|uniref:ANTAR domain-containing protein n=1 Tax=Kocuria sp. CCUG 69068 TaxID=2043138 RepID=UPI001E4DE774|nr:response regulator receiver protein [Kocuria sp. CCUG 69068]